MTAKDALLFNLDLGERILNAYLDGLSDADLLVRPVAGMNHIAWQLGHLIVSEGNLLNAIKPGSSAELPAGFAETYGRDEASTRSDDAGRYASREEYLRLFRAQRAATKAVVSALSEADLDAPAPEPLKQRLPTLGAIASLIGSHVTMHAGQWVAVRRQLGKPVAI